MPIHKGIKMSLVSQWELRILPEYPHPDSSQFTNRSPNVRNNGTFSDFEPPTTSPESKADRLLGRQTSVSVYVPSVSGARFWLRYSIVDSPSTTTPWYYFKLFMNGRHITSWGTNTAKKPSGQVMRALFDPTERWNYKQDGIIYKNNGTESRPFFFGNEIKGTLSPADDGGLIEVHVFRAKGRQRKLAEPGEFKAQDQYGIVMPSGGLIDKPQDARFYDWHLKDPKDSPFATFKFHYRSWDSLISLQLIPEDHPRRLLLPTPSILALNGQSKFREELNEDELHVVPADEIQRRSPSWSPKSPSSRFPDSPRSDHRDSASSNNSIIPWMTTVFDDSPQATARHFSKQPAFASFSQDGKPLSPEESKSQIPMSRFSSGPMQKSPSMIKPWGEVKRRPLPEIPTRGGSVSQHSRNASTASGAPSITPSLLQYLDRDTLSPPPIIGIASEVLIPRPDVDEVVKAGPKEEEHSSGEASSNPKEDSELVEHAELKPRPLTMPKREGMVSPTFAGVFSLPNITTHKNRKSPFKPLPKLITSPNINRYGEIPIDDNDEEQGSFDNTTTLSIAESEWMCRTPSPVLNHPDRTKVEKLWSPGVDKQKGSTKGSSLKKKAMDWYDNARKVSGSTEPESIAADSSFGEVKIKGGNWI